MGWDRDRRRGAERVRQVRRRNRDQENHLKTITAAVKNVARGVGNRPATCRKYYIHPAILDAYVDGSLFARMEQGEQQDSAYAGLGVRPDEYCVMVLIADYQLAAAA